MRMCVVMGMTDYQLCVFTERYVCLCLKEKGFDIIFIYTERAAVEPDDMSVLLEFRCWTE